MNEFELAQPLADAKIGLRGYLCIHTTRPGPAFGGIRVFSYGDDEACRNDAMLLALAMTRKCAFHGIPGGGGKIALDRDAIEDRHAVLLALGKAVEAMRGRFYTASDVGIGPEDLDVIATQTSYVNREHITKATADGLMHAVRACITHTGIGFAGMRAAVQGLGAIGLKAACALIAEGAVVCGSDVDGDARERARANEVTIVPEDELLQVECDLLVPCALGGAIHAGNIDSLRCRVVVGSANNILKDDSLAKNLHERGILFVPDFVSGGGGVIRGAWSHLRGSPGSEQEIAAIGKRTKRLLERARTTYPLEVALQDVEKVLGG